MKCPVFRIFLTLSTLRKIFSRRHIEIFFPRKQVLTLHVNYSNGENLHEKSSNVFYEK